MKKLTIALFAITASLAVSASTVEWSASITADSSPCVSVLDGSSVQGYWVWVQSGEIGNEGSICIGGRLGVTASGSLVATDTRLAYGAYGVTLVLADIGDIVDYGSTVLSPALLRYGCVPTKSSDVYGSGQATGDYSVDLSNGQTVYLAFAQNNLPGSMSPDGTPNYYYGYMRVALENGAPVVTALNADLTGSSIRVAAVPEPTSMALMVLGLAAIALRRKV